MRLDCCGATQERAYRRMTRTNKSVEGVLIEIRTGIQRGRYAPGQRLITSELAEHLGTSLAPVREALHILAGEGLVNIRPNKGASVVAFDAQAFIAGLQILEHIGALALQLLMPRLTDPSVHRELERVLQPIFEAGRRRSPHDFFMAIAASHRLVNDFSGNAYLNPILNRLHLEYFYRQMADSLPDDFWDRYVENYRVTGGLLLDGDGRGAEREWRKHVRWVISVIRKQAK